MVNDLITNPHSEADNICNGIIVMSDEFAKVVGLSYSELWIFIMVLVGVAIIYYMIVAFGALYFKPKWLFKLLFWGSFIIIAIITFITMNALACIYVNPE